MVYGRKNCLQQILMKLSERTKEYSRIIPYFRKCMKIIIDQITREITTDQNDFQNTLNIQFGHLVSILSAISLIALVGSILILKWFPQLNCDRKWPVFKSNINFRSTSYEEPEVLKMKATRNSIHFNLFCSMSFKALFLLIVDIVTSTLVRFSQFQTRDFGSGAFQLMFQSVVVIGSAI